MSDFASIPVSPRHSVQVPREYMAFIENAPSSDFILRTVTSRNVGEMPLMTADIVIAGRETRETFPLAAEYPLHFRKCYFPGRLHGDTQVEYERQRQASEIIGAPMPIGHTPRTFRSCFIPGKSYAKLSPFGREPEEQNIPLAHELPVPVAIGLWKLLEEAFQLINKLHSGGIAHGDAELHNFIVCLSPLELFLIDFENAVEKKELSDGEWTEYCEKDMLPLLREAVYLQCALGRQPGVLANYAWENMSKVVSNPDRFRKEIGSQSAIRA